MTADLERGLAHFVAHGVLTRGQRVASCGHGPPSIQRSDFPTVRRGYEPDAVDAHLRHVADEVESPARPRPRRVGGLRAGAADPRGRRDDRRPAARRGRRGGARARPPRLHRGPRAARAARRDARRARRADGPPARGRRPAVGRAALARARRRRDRPAGGGGAESARRSSPSRSRSRSRSPSRRSSRQPEEPVGGHARDGRREGPLEARPREGRAAAPSPTTRRPRGSSRSTWRSAAPRARRPSSTWPSTTRSPTPARVLDDVYALAGS